MLMMQVSYEVEWVELHVSPQSSREMMKLLLKSLNVLIYTLCIEIATALMMMVS